VAPLIPRNTTLPTTRSEVFTTAIDNQDSVEVHVTQGERPTARENKSLARFHLDGIPPQPRGVPQIEVAFTLDTNGILSVTARDRATNREQHITVAPSSGLSAGDVDRMVRDATQYAEQDRARQQNIELRNGADALLYQAARAGEQAESLDEEHMQILGEAAAALEAALQTEDTTQIRDRMDDLRNALDMIRMLGASLTIEDRVRRFAAS
jgi:molecular chaperone DnaK